MIFKILMLLLVVAGLIYWVKQPRRVQADVPYASARPRRPGFIALCVAAAISAVASLLSAVLWMGGVAGGVSGGGYRGQITPSIITHSAWLDRAEVATRITMVET